MLRELATWELNIAFALAQSSDGDGTVFLYVPSISPYIGCIILAWHPIVGKVPQSYDCSLAQRGLTAALSLSGALQSCLEVEKPVVSPRVAKTSCCRLAATLQLVGTPRNALQISVCGTSHGTCQIDSKPAQ